ncbi:ExeM/NucH family extracellular endonuclease [Oerskovia jenensis]|uniref:5'-nucleotidase n=1 Tax=Oerskovia jenensis TaxID=162169 RepID=A0ABS2LEH1_9CELL|nr:ExeM/NucH family extracellular endonuclease [Oerskovia jenensis]MBM7478801.1 5'-nucleotidase [Oerskovia jenensis]
MVAATLSASLVATAALSTVAAGTASAAVDGSSVVINEAYLNGGSANAPYLNKFVELYNPTAADIDLTGWSVQYRSATGTGASNGVVPLTGTIKAGGYYLVQGASNGANGAALPTPDATGTIAPQGQNGTLALVRSASAITITPGSVVGNAQVVDLLGYGTSNTFETAAAPAGTANTVPGSLNRAAGADTDDNSKDFAVSSTVTPQNSGGGSGPGPDPEPGTARTIAEIQGTGDASPFVGQTVTTRGVVTATYPSGGFDGLYIQTAGSGGDLDLATHTASDGLFVYSKAAATALQVGQHVEVTGVVSEYFGLTQVTPAATGWKVLTDPAEVVKPANVAYPATAADREKLEGMLVQPAGDYVVADNYDTNYYGSVVLASGTEPLRQPTSVGRPGSAEAAAAVADANARRINLDDGATTNFNNAANKAKPLPYLTGGAPVRVGALATFTSPVVLDYRFDGWNFQPVTELTPANAAAVQPATFANTRTDAPEAVGGDVTVAAFNVLNYFTTTGDQVSGCQFYTDREGNPITVRTGCDARGAANAANLQRQETKIVAAINALDADVVSIQEIENSKVFGKNRDAALSTLTDRLNAAAGAGTWAFVPSPAALPASEDVIRTAFIYRPAAVETVGASVIHDVAAFDNAREPLAQTFRVAGGEPSTDFVVIANHFKSKGSGSGADADQGDGQGASNASRVKQATALATFADQVSTAAGTDKVLLAGDFNSYAQEDPIKVLTDAGYVDLGPTTGKETYLFDGLVGSLDHVLASPGAAAAVTDTDIWNINSVEPIANEYSRFNYNVSNLYDTTAFRSSDHDPIVVGLELGGEEPGGVKELDLLAINDFHGRIDANTVAFAGTVEQLRAANPAGTAFLSVGDNIGASLFASALQDDQPTIDVLNALDLSASAVGNHEFDKGFADLTGRVSDAADWSYLGANVYAKGTTNPALPEYAVIDVDGVKVGVIGAVTEETPTLVTPSGVADLDFGDPVEAVNRVAAQLRDGDAANGEADLLVALYHEGASAGTPDGSTLEQELAHQGAFEQIVNDTDARVSAIFTGHTHKQYAWEAPIPGTDRTRPVLQTGSYGENIGHVSLTFDTATDLVTDYSVENVKRTTTPAAELVATYPRVAEVKTIVDAALAQAEVIGAQPVGSVTADITTAYLGGSYVNGTYTGSGPLPSTGRDDRASESTLGNLVATSLRDTLADPARGGADFGVVNPGGLRNELYHGADGVITYAEANAVLPFVNNLWTVSLTGAQVETMLEQQWQTNADGTRPSRPYLALGLSDNVSYTAKTADVNATPGDNITSVVINGEPLDPAKTYRVATFSFLATGGDNFRVFSQGTDARDSGLIDRDAWISYLQTHPDLAPDFARRGVVADGLGTVTAGESVTAAVSRLNLTSLGSPANTGVSAYLVPAGTAFDPANPGTAVATGTVTNGAASLEVPVPAETAGGEYGVYVVAAPSGTVTRLALTVEGADLPDVVLDDVTAKAQCVGGRVQLSVKAVNGETLPIDVRYTTAYGEKKFTKLAPGKIAAQTFNTRATSVPAGTVRVAAYKWQDGQGFYEAFDVAYPAVTCG